MVLHVEDNNSLGTQKIGSKRDHLYGWKSATLQWNTKQSNVENKYGLKNVWAEKKSSWMNFRFSRNEKFHIYSNFI